MSEIGFERVQKNTMDKKAKAFFTFVLILLALFLSMTVYCFKIFSTVEYFLTPLIILGIIDIVLIILALSIYEANRQEVNFDFGKEIIIFVVCICLFCMISQYATTFTEIKWHEKEFLRRFMVGNFIDIQSFGFTDNKYCLSNYTRAEAKEMLYDEMHSEKVPDVTVEFVDSSAGRFSSDIYYAYTSLDGTDYWLVLEWFGTDPNMKTDISRTEIIPSGTHLEIGKTIYVD